MDLQLYNKHAVIAGGSSGIGFACALGFLREGARVTVISRNQHQLIECEELLLEQVPFGKNRVFTIACDLNNAKQAKTTINRVVKSMGAIDILVNSMGTGKRLDPLEISAENWSQDMSVKFLPYMNTITPVIKKMKQQGHGSIVNIAGTGGKIPRLHAIPRGAASSALIMASVGLARAYAPHGVRVNVVNPNRVITGNEFYNLPLRGRQEQVTLQNAVDAYNDPDSLPMGRMALPSEVADAVLFLSSSRASYISGAILAVDGSAGAMIV